MKKVLALLLVLVMVLGLVACGSKDSSESTASEAPASDAQEAPAAEDDSTAVNDAMAELYPEAAAQEDPAEEATYTRRRKDAKQ